jgi:hypothetical protein
MKVIKIVFLIMLIPVITIAADIYDLTREGYTSFGSDKYSSSAADIDISASDGISFGSSASCTDINFTSDFDMGSFFEQMLNDIKSLVGGEGLKFLQTKLVNASIESIARSMAENECSGESDNSLLSNILGHGGAESLLNIAQDANTKLNEARAMELNTQAENSSIGRVSGSYAIKAFGFVFNISNVLSGLAGSLAKDKSKVNEIKAKTYAECVKEMTAYYTEWIVNMLNQKIKFDQDFQKYVRRSCEIAAQEANSDLTSFLVRSAGVNPVHNITPQTALGTQHETFTPEQQEKINKEVLVFYDGTVIGNINTLKGQGSENSNNIVNNNTSHKDNKGRTYNDIVTPSINFLGKRATLPTASENLNIIKKAFFQELKIGNNNNITDYGFERSMYSSSADPVLTLIFLLELYSVHECYQNHNCSGFEDGKYPDTAEYIVNNYCVYNRTIFDLFTNAMSRFNNLTRLAHLSKQGSSTIEETNKALINDSKTLLQALLLNIRYKIFDKVGIPNNAFFNDNFNNDTVDALVKKVIIPGFENYGAYADIMSFAKRFYSLDYNLSSAELENVDPKEYVDYVPAGYFYTLLMRTSYPNLADLRSYLNNNFSSYLLTALNNYLSEKKSFELNQINLPIFEKRMSDIFYYAQSNALKSIKIEMDNEYNSLSRRMQIRCTF